jgi:acyl carrier protein
VAGPVRGESCVNSDNQVIARGLQGLSCAVSTGRFQHPGRVECRAKTGLLVPAPKSQGRRCAVIATVRKLLRPVTLKNRVHTNVIPASCAVGGVMVSAALVQRSSAEVFLANEIQACIAQHLKVDIVYMGADSHLTDDLGLDLFEITELLTVLEERFGVDAETADEPSLIEFVGDLIRYIESSKHCLETREARTRLRNGSVDSEQLVRLDEYVRSDSLNGDTLDLGDIMNRSRV